MTNRILGPVAVALLLPFFMQSAIADTQRPNILIAISDDHSWTHTSIQGSAFVETPNLDGVANSGLLFANAYAGSPGCSPSRAALLTGIWHRTARVDAVLNKRCLTLAEALKANGYTTLMSGKRIRVGQCLEYSIPMV